MGDYLETQIPNKKMLEEYLDKSIRLNQQLLEEDCFKTLLKISQQLVEVCLIIKVSKEF